MNHQNKRTDDLKKYLTYHRRPGGQGEITSIYDKEVRTEEEESKKI